MKMSSAQVHVKPVLLVEEFRSCVLNKKFCIDLFASSFASMSIIFNLQSNTPAFFETIKRCKHRPCEVPIFAKRWRHWVSKRCHSARPKRFSPHSLSASRFVSTRLFSSFAVQIIHYISYCMRACTPCAGEIKKKCWCI